MKYTYHTIAVLCLSLCFLVSPAVAQEGSSLGWIYVDGNRFVNQSGETVIFRGVNIRDPHNLELEDHWAKWHFTEARNWGANVIRIPIHPRAWRARGQEAYLKLIDQAVQWAHELEIHLILDWHSIGNLKQEKFQHEMYVTTPQETFAFWNAVSSRYAREPAIALYELYNEPTVSGSQFGEMSWPEWKEMNEQMIRIIRANNPRAIIGVAGFNWAYDLTPVNNDPIYANGIAYISHPYPQKRDAPWEGKWEADWGFVADRYPVILTEIGFAATGEAGAHIPVHGDETYGKTLVEYCDKKGISWVVWCFDPDWPPYMFTDWDYTPTRQGTFFKAVMQEINE